MLALIAIFIGWKRTSGVAFSLTNVGTVTMKAVTVHVTGSSYLVGDLGPGATKKIDVNPAGESHIEVAFSDSRRLIIDCYIEDGYGGRITAEVTPEKVISVKSMIETSPL